MKHLVAILTIFIFYPATASAAGAGFVKPIKNNTIQKVSYDEIHDEAIFNCPWAKQINQDKEKIVSMLIKIEKEYNLPENLRGMLIAAACHESGYEISAKGDYRKKRAMAVGLFQMWPWWEKAYNIDRKNPEDSARAYMQHIKKMLNKVDRQCKIRNPTKKWLAAWATAIRAPKKNGRCNERPLFYRVLRKWHKNINFNKAERNRLLKDGTKGC